ncbi:hypothetical protein PVAND_012492 [Polypedilum vanderplanki]|uniref:Protein sleepless n=1 Tax=Polypedilum vanderplanki TaxID=319348 RepID=A0A9J6CMP3_POLVA|nr:hypothetical protein PVAND_012492 [Polypedilum vanderplanki]
MKTLIGIIIFFAFCYIAVTALKCKDCRLVTPERCRTAKNIPIRECEFLSEETMTNLSVKTACITATRIIADKLFYTRMCGVRGGENDTCDWLEDRFEDEGKVDNFTCSSCEKDLCNASNISYVNIIAFIISVVTVVVMKLH